TNSTCAWGSRRPGFDVVHASGKWAMQQLLVPFTFVRSRLLPGKGGFRKRIPAGQLLNRAETGCVAHSLAQQRSSVGTGSYVKGISLFALTTAVSHRNSKSKNPRALRLPSRSEAQSQGVVSAMDGQRLSARCWR